MAPFKPADLDSSLLAKRKQTINPKLLNDDNMSLDAIKQWKMALSSSALPPSLLATSTSKSSNLYSKTSPQSSKSSSTTPSQQASIETVANEDDMSCRNAGWPKNLRFILKSMDDDDDDDDDGEDSTHLARKKTHAHQTKTPNHVEKEAECSKGEKSDDEELSESSIPISN